MILVLILLYLSLGTLIPLAWHKKPTAETVDTFDADRFYRQEGDLPEQVVCIDDPQDALLRRIRLIESAKAEIFCCTYEFHADESGKTVLAALLDAADRGVRVRLLIDSLAGSFNTDMRSAYLDTELMLAVDCPELNALLRRTAADRMQHSRIWQNGAYQNGKYLLKPKVSRFKKQIYRLLRIVIRPIRHLL